MPTATHITVKELVDAANAVHDAAKAMKNYKDDSRKISKLTLEIATSVENTATAAILRGEDINVTVSVNAALGATRDIFIQCARFMREVARQGQINRHFKKGLTADTVGGYLSSLEGLHELLKIHNHVCGIMLEPFVGVGIDRTCNKEILNANINSMVATYDGLKSTVSVMVHMTEGLPWPLKAVPQTFLYVLQLFESCQSVHSKITSLLDAVQTLWTTVEQISPKVVEDNIHLRDHLHGFFEILQRIAIRLHIVLRVGQVKRTLAIHTISACLALEEQRLAEARKAITTVFSVQLVNVMNRLESKVTQLQPSAPVSPHYIDMRISTTLPPKPIVFHGRDAYLTNAVRLLTASSPARLAVLGTGGIGKTKIALAILYEPRIVEHLESRRFFVSCEALVDANSVLISLSKLLGLPVSGDLLTIVIARLTDMPRALLVLDNFETVWFTDGAPDTAVEELIGRLAQIQSLSIIITCRGILLPQLVEWSNPDTAALEPFSLVAALETFQDRAGFRLTGVDEDIAKELLTAVDHMPLAVTLLGQLARRGTPVSELLDRWNREHSALLRTHNIGRINSAEVSVKLSLTMVRSADASGEALQLLSVCCMPPDGLSPTVFERMRAHFKNIDRARDTVTASALASLGPDRVLKTLSPVRHVVLENHPAHSNHRDALHAIYFDIADRLPVKINEAFEELAAAAAPEMGNLSSLLLNMVSRPSQEIVDAVVRLTNFLTFSQPTVTLASALLPHLEPHPEWKASCLRALSMGNCHIGDYVSALEDSSAAAQLHLELGDRSSAARSKAIAGNSYQLLGKPNEAEILLEEARGMHAELGDDIEEALARSKLAVVMQMNGDYSGAIEHLTAARLTFDSLGDTFFAALCSSTLGIVYLGQGEIAAAMAELEASRSVFIGLGHQALIVQAILFLGSAQGRQGDFELAEKNLGEAQMMYQRIGDRLGLACCAEVFGYLRNKQQRGEESLARFKLASRIYEKLQMRVDAQRCQKWIKLLESADCATV